MNVLAVGAHPDDIEYGCGGTLVRYAQQGHRVYLLIVTDGGLGGETEVRRAEQREAGRILGAEEIFFGGYRDTELACDRGLIMKIEEIIKQVEPKCVYVNYFDDTHQDHRNVSLAVIPAARSIPNVLFYEGLSTQNFTPTVFVDIDMVLHKKLALLEAHASQVLRTNIEGMSIVEIARSSANFRGIQGRVRHAEGFLPLRLFMDI